MASDTHQDGATQSFDRLTRLTSGAQFRYVFARPDVTQDRYFRVLRRTNDGNNCRLGLAVSRKVCATAAGRNRIKRLVRESFRLNRRRLEADGNWDFVVLPSGQAPHADNAALRKSLEGHWQKVMTTAPR